MNGTNNITCYRYVELVDIHQPLKPTRITSERNSNGRIALNA